MWYVEIFMVFYDDRGIIHQMEVANTVNEYFQWANVAAGYDYSVLIIKESEYDKVVQAPSKYKVVNGKLKNTTEFAVC